MRRAAILVTLIAGAATMGAAALALTGPWRESPDPALPNLPAGEVSAEDPEHVPCSSCDARHQRLKKKRVKEGE